MKTASWVLLAFAGVATLLLSLVSAARAYGTYNDSIGGVSVSKLSAGRPDVETAVRSRRATASAYSAGFATLFLLITVGPYRRGDAWAWWALLAGMLVVSRADPAQGSIARHRLEGVGWGRSGCGGPYPTSPGWRGPGARSWAFAAATWVSRDFGLTFDPNGHTLWSNVDPRDVRAPGGLRRCSDAAGRSTTSTPKSRPMSSSRSRPCGNRDSARTKREHRLSARSAT